MCMRRGECRRMLIINVVFSLFLSPVQLLKYRIKNKKGSPWVIFLVSSKKMVFGFYYIISLVSREAPEGHHWSRVVGVTLGVGWSRKEWQAASGLTRTLTGTAGQGLTWSGCSWVFLEAVLHRKSLWVPLLLKTAHSGCP